MTRRDELAAFLRARRDAVSPADVGLPAGRSRRTKGLRREEIAMLAGVSVTWYTWLEQGRPINASVDVLDGAGAGAAPRRRRARSTCWHWRPGHRRSRSKQSSMHPTRWCG